VALELTVCARCLPQAPELCAAIQDLCQTYGGQLLLTELSCIGSCDEGQAVFIDMDFCPDITASRLRTKIKYLLGDSPYSNTAGTGASYAR
jgi:NADH:ubiquinone oxidoreductase subunit E